MDKWRQRYREINRYIDKGKDKKIDGEGQIALIVRWVAGEMYKDRDIYSELQREG